MLNSVEMSLSRVAVTDDNWKVKATHEASDCRPPSFGKRIAMDGKDVIKHF